jgi:DHA1 family inner membrane transport protein
VVVIAALTMASVLAVVPRIAAHPGAGVRTELGALRRPQVVLTLLVGVVGFGGMFAVYSYIAPLATDVAGIPRGAIPALLLVYGVGGVVGTALGGRLADLALFRSLIGGEIFTGLVLASVLIAATHGVSLFVVVFLLALAASVLVVCLQMRLMSVAGDAQMLGAALNHSALNAANALGAWLGGAVIAAGFGYRAPAAVGAVLALGGLGFLAASAVLRRRELTEVDAPGAEPLDALEPLTADAA